LDFVWDAAARAKLAADSQGLTRWKRANRVTRISRSRHEYLGEKDRKKLRGFPSNLQPVLHEGEPRTVVEGIVVTKIVVTGVVGRVEVEKPDLPAK